jgi:hypothetical protein
MDMHKPEPTQSQSPRVDLASESVAGEEDPGASADLSLDPPAGAGTSAQPAGRGDAGSNSAGKPVDKLASSNIPAAPGDEAPPGTPGTGEAVCPECGGTGRIDSGACPECGGTGKVNLGIGGG